MMTWHDSYSPYGKHTGQCVGRILHFVYHYCGLHQAENITVGFREADADVIKYGQELFATYHWDDDVPVFNFFPNGWNSGSFHSPRFGFEERNEWVSAQIEKRDMVSYPSDYRVSLKNELHKFQEKFDNINHYIQGMDSDVKGLSNRLVARYAKLIRSLPIKELDDYIHAAKLYEAIEEEVTPG